MADPTELTPGARLRLAAVDVEEWRRTAYVDGWQRALTAAQAELKEREANNPDLRMRPGSVCGVLEKLKGDTHV